jgi:hypothetical protein
MAGFDARFRAARMPGTRAVYDIVTSVDKARLKKVGYAMRCRWVLLTEFAGQMLDRDQIGGLAA